MRLSALLAFALTGSALAAPTGTQYVAATWTGGTAHFLDGGLNSLGTFATGYELPNGVAFNAAAGEILVGMFGSTSNSITRFDMNGVPISTFAASGANLQGMVMVGGELGIANASNINFVDPFTGAFIRSIPNPASDESEGLAYRPANNALYSLDDALIRALNPADGSVLFTIPNPAVDESFAGTGLTWNPLTDELVAMGESGNWWLIDPLTGTVNTFGNDALQVYGLEAIPTPGAAALLGLGALVAARRRR